MFYKNPYRIWLESNKIFFEIITATFLTVMAIIISYQQTKLTKIQTQIAQQQLVQEERIESIERTANWGELRNAIWEIMD